MAAYPLNLSIEDFTTDEYLEKDGMVTRSFFKTFVISNYPFIMKITCKDLLVANEYDSAVIQPGIWSNIVIDDTGTKMRLILLSVYGAPASEYSIEKLGKEWKLCLEK